MKKVNTKLMSRLFSDSTSDEFKTKVLNAIDEAKASGESSFEEDDEKLDLKSNEDGDVIITDKNNDEVTIARDNEETGNVDLIASETQPDVNVTRTPGIDGEKANRTVPEIPARRTPGIDGERIEDTVPEVEVSIEPSITDAGKAGIKNFSFKLKNSNFSTAYKFAKGLVKVFSECPIANTTDELEEMADKALNMADDKNFSEIEERAKLITDNANELAAAAADMESTQDPELASKVKEMADTFMKDLESESDDLDIDLTEVKEMSKKFSEQASEIINKEGLAPTESPTNAPTEASTEAPTEAATEAATEEPTEAPTQSEKDKKSTEKAAELSEEANKIAEKVDNMGDDKKVAEEVKAECDALDKKLSEVDEDPELDIDTDSIKEMSKKFSAQAEAVLGTVRNFSQSKFMRVGNIPNPVIKTSTEQRQFSNGNIKKSANPYLYTKF